MKIRFITSCCAFAFALIQSASAQGFINLDFEDAAIVPDPSSPAFAYGAVYASDAMPGWTGYLGTTQVTDVLYNDLTLGNASIDIVGQGYGVIEGQYSVVLQPGFDPFGSGQNVGASISQTGLVPASAQSLQFKAFIADSALASDFSVSFAGHNLALVTLGTSSNYTLYGADVSAFAGQVGAVTIAASAQPNIAPYYFDSFVFSPSSVPEPSVMSLAIVCILFYCRCRTRSNTALEPTGTAPVSSTEP
jgi:hypothetical protein